MITCAISGVCLSVARRLYFISRSGTLWAIALRCPTLIQELSMKQGRTVLEAKRFGCHCCTSAAPLIEAVTKMVEHDISSLVVTDAAGFLAGIITRSDVLRGYLANDDWQRQPVGDYMTKDVVTVAPEDRLSTIANLLLEHHIHRVVVVRDEQGRPKPLAVVSDTDLIYHMVKEID
jgi:signal-transduction protein with cAMP-binding, CBS, and nucleotidyltransferase domain